MRVLHVVDMSPCIYAGTVNKASFMPGDLINTSEGYRERNIPTGGASMLFNILGQYMGDGPIAFVADRNPTIKKELNSDYKGTRSHPYDVKINKEVAEYILRDCGFTVYAEDGYEADDVIYSIVQKNLSRYDKIYVHTADSDLYYLVSEKVEILPAHSRAKHVTMENYPVACKANTYTEYNTVLFEKFLRADPSKNLMGLGRDTQKALREYFYTPKMKPLLSRPVVCKAHIQRQFPKLVNRFILFHPLLVPGDFEIPQEGDKETIQKWAYAIGNKKVPGRKADMSSHVKKLLESSLYTEAC